jgi:outer membrane assembly lipoprotein YfiO
MSRRTGYLFLLVAALGLYSLPAPAPVIYTPGEGVRYEAVGADNSWRRERAQDQLQVAQEAFEKQDYSLALRASKRVVRTWPASDFAPAAQYLLARCHEMKRQDERAFEEYQKIFEKYPKSEHIEEALQHQYDIATRFLNGQRFRLWNTIPFFPDMEKTVKLYERVIRSGPFSEVAPKAQIRIGAAYEKRKDYPAAAAAYERAADRYHDQPAVAADALYRAGIAHAKQAATAEYDQGTAGQAIATFTDFITLYPEDLRVGEAREIIGKLRNEQARGNFAIAEFYAKRQKWGGARIYYNEVVLRGPDSTLAPVARQRIDDINQRMPAATP